MMSSYGLLWKTAPSGHLDKYARAPNRTLSLIQKVNIILQSLAGLQHIHGQDIIHRDVKPANVLVTGNEDTPTIKLCDFGMSRFIDHIREHSLRPMSAGVGTKTFNAPEFVQRRTNVQCKRRCLFDGCHFTLTSGC